MKTQISAPQNLSLECILSILIISTASLTCAAIGIIKEVS